MSSSSNIPDASTPRGCPPGDCAHGVNRRQFVRSLSLAAAGSFFLPRLLMAGPFVAGDFQNLVPADKKLTAAWIKSLFDRGEPTIYRGPDLKYIGMPIGGICAGQLYLGGDGELWHWDIFNNQIATGSTHYKEPLLPTEGLDQGFALRILAGATLETRPLNAKGFPGVTFCGEYPIGKVTYADSAFPLQVSMEAFSPFIPLHLEDSSLPATVIKFTVKNTSSATITAELGGWLENVVAQKSGQLFRILSTNRTLNTQGALVLECGFRDLVSTATTVDRPLIVFEDFEREDWGQWKVEGDAFGKAPTEGAPHAAQKLKGHKGQRLANSFATKGDQGTGKLTSRSFKIERRFVNFLIGGGNQMRPDGQVDAGINLWVDGTVVRNATGTNSDTMTLSSWDVSDIEGRLAHLEILDETLGSWGHIEIDQIEFSDRSPLVTGSASEQPDAGSLVLALLEATTTDRVNPALQGESAQVCFALPKAAEQAAERPAGTNKANKLVGAVVRSFTLEAGASREITFVLAWHFPNLVFPLTFNAGQAATNKTVVEKGRYYGTKFDSAQAVAGYIAKNESRLTRETRLWRDTWYDSTLPYWFLDRTVINASILATSTCHRFANGRFYGWEGVGCCAGTCTHVWHYEQAMGRLFPELDILLRDRVDFNPKVGFNDKTGIIGHRGDANRSQAVDGQAGTILRAYRDHLVSPDTAFLNRNWPQIKLATEWLMQLDSDRDGILDKLQANTLDGTWYGKIPWITSLGLAAVEATAQMALLMGDAPYAEACKKFVATGKANFVKTFWNGEYFEQIHDPAQLEHVGSYNGCLIDQVMGQGWAFQVGLDRVLPEEKTKAALAAIWKYNFTPDVGPYRKERPAGRWYALPGEAGTLMCSWPRGDQLRVTKGFDYYFNECMNGFEHQVAGHMIAEGMLLEGFAIERAVHDRYHGSKRNPWNEVECGDHYARSMASYGVFLSVCGFSYDGPAGHLGFAPKLTPENFKAPFTTAEGWGSFRQTIEPGTLQAEIALKWGRLRVRSLALASTKAPASARVQVGATTLTVTLSHLDGRTVLTLPSELSVQAGDTIRITLS